MFPADREDSLRLDLLHERLRANLLGETRPPRRLGRFELRERIGSGGMGTVYEGWDPTLSRPVALKLLHLDGRLSQARIRREAQALARLQHRHIVAVFDIGTAEDRVYVAMERVDGDGLDAWFATRPSWRALARVFSQAARALAHAHDQGVVHGDIKPSNMLLDAEGEVKLIDFGLAQLREEAGSSLSDRNAGEGSTTTVGGTLGYTAPEKPRAHQDSAAADQFSLCVALYEGLRGTRPFPASDAFERAVVEGPAPIPNVPRGLARAVARGLARAPEDRWPSMEALASALEGVLRPRRWRRNALGLGLTGSAVLLAAPADQASSSCERAGADIAARWQAAQESVRVPFDQSSRAYLVDSGARVTEGLDAYADALVAAQRSACEGGPSEPDRDAIAQCLLRREIALFELADRLSTDPSDRVLQRAISSVHALPPIDDCSDPRYRSAQFKPPDALALRAPAAALRAELEAVHPLLRRAEYAPAKTRLLALLDEVNALGFVPLRIEALQSLGVATTGLAEHEASALYSTEAYFLAREHHLEVRALKIASNLVGLHTDRGEYEEALRWGRHAQSLLVDAPDRIVASKLHFNLAVTLQRMARFDEAQHSLKAALELRENALGPDHLLTAHARFELGTIAMQQGRLDEARSQIERVRNTYIDALGPSHPEVATANNNLGIVLAQQGDLAGAERVWRACLEAREQAFGPEHPYLSSTLANLAVTVIELGRPQEAIPLAERGLAIRRAKLEPGHPAIGRSLLSLAEVHESLGQLEAAEQTYREALANLSSTLEPTHPKVRAAQAQLDQVARARRGADEPGEPSEPDEPDEPDDTQ